MKVNTRLVTIMLCVAAGCQDRGDTQVDAVEANDLGVVSVEIHHGVHNGDRLLTIRGLDANDEEIAVTTLRTGMVLYSAEPELMPQAWSAGTELTASIGADSFDSITPDREPHEAALPYQQTLATFVRLEPVAAAIKDEAGIWFPQASDEVAFSATTCTASTFPTNIGAPQQCCLNGTTSYHKIAANAPKNQNLLGVRTYNAACTSSSGGSCIGTACFFGPCGGANSSVSSPNTTSAVVFHPTSQPTVCGADSNGTTASGGLETPESYTGSQSLYAGVTPTCPQTNCCYQQNLGISQPGAVTCNLGTDASCSSNLQCYAGYCSPYSHLCNDDCGLPDACPRPHCCGATDDCGHPCGGACEQC